LVHSLKKCPPCSQSIHQSFLYMKLTEDLLCKEIFYNNQSVFQEKDSGRMIGLTQERDSHYCLEEPTKAKGFKSRLSHSFMSKSILSNKERAFPYHCHLGHPSFRIGKVLFPSLYSKLDVESLRCEVCELAKHKCVPFSISNKRSTFPFYLIHTHIWSPST